jgi:hypothetical protein
VRTGESGRGECAVRGIMDRLLEELWRLPIFPTRATSAPSRSAAPGCGKTAETCVLDGLGFPCIWDALRTMLCIKNFPCGLPNGRFGLNHASQSIVGNQSDTNNMRVL